MREQFKAYLQVTLRLYRQVPNYVNVLEVHYIDWQSMTSSIEQTLQTIHIEILALAIV